MAETSFDLGRFVDAQRGTYETALSEIKRGHKQTHWMWFIFPQIAGLGASHMAQRYAVHSLDEARAYLAHPTLGVRYLECVAALQQLTETTAHTVFGGVDAMKLRSSLTLFAIASELPAFDAAIGRWFAGKRDLATIERLNCKSLIP